MKPWAPKHHCFNKDQIKQIYSNALLPKQAAITERCHRLSTKANQIYKIYIHNSYLHYCLCSLPQLMAKRLARPRHRPHGITTIVHAGRSWPCSDITRVLLLGKWHRLLWWHPAICHGGWARSKHAQSAMHGWLLWSHLMFQPHLLHLLLNLCNLIITKCKFISYDFVTLMPNWFGAIFNWVSKVITTLFDL